MCHTKAYHMCGSMPLRVLRHGWRSSCDSPIQPGLFNDLLVYRRTAGQHRLASVTTVVLVLVVLLVRAALFILGALRSALLLLLRCSGAAQIAHSRFNLIHQPNVLVIADYPSFRGVVGLLQSLRADIHVL